MGIASHVSSESPPPFAAQFAEVEVDVETGQVTVTKLVMAVDCGVADQPDDRQRPGRGRDDAGARLCAHRGARPRRGGPARERAVSGPTGSSGPTTHRRPRSSSCRPWSRAGPFGAKAVGEIAIDGVAPAVRNAILDATGVALNALPLTPERVWNALRRAESPDRQAVAGVTV